jgi:hypothetical protein
MDALVELSKEIGDEPEPEPDYAELSFDQESNPDHPRLSFDDDHTVETRAVPRREIDALIDEREKKRGPAQQQVDSQDLGEAPAILDAAAIKSLSEDILSHIDASATGAETPDQLIHRRISLLVERAQAEHKIGNDAFSIVAMDLALEQKPDSAAAQREIQEHRETLFQLYRKYLGDLAACPRLKVPMHELPLKTMDHRTGFLLSRVDGMLTLEDILDISGMSRLEAYRHLSRLVLQGILAID